MDFKDVKGEIYKQARDDELSEFIGKIIGYIIVCGIFGYVGYRFSIEENCDTFKCIVFGALLPFCIYGIYEKFIDSYNIGIIGSLIIYFVFLFLYILICSSIPVYVAFIVFAIIIIIQIIEIQDVNNRYKERMGKPIPKNEIEQKQRKIAVTSYKIDIPKNNDYADFSQDKEEYYCERCEKRISQEEYDEYAGLCEECSAEIYFGERYDYDDFDMFK